jgi:hypothetical protein
MSTFGGSPAGAGGWGLRVMLMESALCQSDIFILKIYQKDTQKISI